MMSPHNLHIVLIYIFIVDRRLYIDVAFYSLSEKARGGEEACYTLYVYKAAIKPVAPHRKQKRNERNPKLKKKSELFIQQSTQNIPSY